MTSSTSDHGVLYMTKEGHRKLENDLAYLVSVRLSEVAERLRLARDEGGELGENAEYAAAKDEQSLVEGWIQRIEGQLSRARIIEDSELSTVPGLVGINTVVTVQEDGYDPEKFHIVGPVEADPQKGRISYESPLGQALLGKQVGAQVSIQAPDGTFSYKILEVSH